MGVYKTTAKIVPIGIRNHIESLLAYAGIKLDHEDFIGFMIVSSLMLGAIGGFFLSPVLEQPFWIFFASILAVINISVYLWLELMVDKKSQLIEDSLPDALQLAASNLRAGTTPDKAIMLSSRREFGPLKQEIDIVGKKIALGSGVGTALSEMSKRVKSRSLGRSVELINSGLTSGGSLAVLLESTSASLRDQSLVGKKIKAAITMYVIFIFSAAAIISPVLFGLSSFLVEVLKSSLSRVDIPSSASASIPIQLQGASISNEFLMFFVVFFIISNCLMASMLLGLIVKGRQREGVRYFIPMIILAVPLFLLSRYLIGLALRGLLAV